MSGEMLDEDDENALSENLRVIVRSEKKLQELRERRRVVDERMAIARHVLRRKGLLGRRYLV